MHSYNRNEDIIRSPQSFSPRQTQSRQHVLSVSAVGTAPTTKISTKSTETTTNCGRADAIENTSCSNLHDSTGGVDSASLKLLVTRVEDLMMQGARTESAVHKLSIRLHQLENGHTNKLRQRPEANTASIGEDVKRTHNLATETREIHTSRDSIRSPGAIDIVFDSVDG